MLRRQAWETNLKYIKQHNSESDKGIHTFTVAMNEFGDMIGDEFKALYFNAKLKRNYKKTRKTIKTLDPIPERIDWRTTGFVSSVKDQGMLGYPVLFAAVSSLESVFAIQVSKKLVELSVMNLAECATITYPDQAFEYVRLNNGIDTAGGYKSKVSLEHMF